MENGKKWLKEWATPIIALAAILGFLEVRLGSLDAHAKERFDALDTRIVGLETRLTGLEITMAGLGGKLDLLLQGLDITVAPRGQAE